MSPAHIDISAEGGGAYCTAAATAVVVAAIATDITAPSGLFRGRRSCRHCRWRLRALVAEIKSNRDSVAT